MDPLEARVTYCCEVHPHHAEHNALYRMVSAVGAYHIVGNRRYDAPSPLTEWCNRRLFSLSGHGTYTVSNLRDEAIAALMLLARPGRICHLLHGDDSYRYLGFLNGVRGARIIASFHQPTAIFDERVGWKGCLRRLSALHVVARAQIPYFARFIPADRIHFIPHPIDAEFFSPDPAGPPGGGRCIFVGQWLRDFTLLRDTIERVHARNRGVQFTVVTFPGRFPIFEGMENVELRSGVTDGELRALYRRANLLLLPLEDCTFNNSMLEGMACGLPVITNDVGGVRDYADPSCAVMLRRGGGGGEMAEAVLALLDDARLRGEMAARARERALAVHWTSIVPEFMRMYRAVAGAIAREGS